ncbi:DsbA family protein [Ectopseudomonas mendocina]|uniref:DsbA family protein n=1 Tax=Ectopseudomonas mendocina TaxID=300 RepID=A0ABZ2RIH4_ECTME
MSKKLHYIYDPYCSWCYAISSFVQYANAHGVEVELHGGGMITGERVAAPSDELRKILKDNQPKITELAGVQFSDSYYQTLDQDWVMNSIPPSAAVVAAQQSAGKGLEMIKAIQAAQFQKGWVISEQSTIDRLAEELSLNNEAFKSAYAQLIGGEITQHFADTRALMEKRGAKGFPTLLLELNGKQSLIPTQNVYGNQDAWREILKLT